MPALNELMDRTYKNGTYKDAVTFLHVYVIEPHPKTPDLSPYRGEVWEVDNYSDKRQPLVYDDRVINAKAMLPALHDDTMAVVDDLTPGDNNPVWCTYGPCPNCSFLIGQDGMIKYVFKQSPKTADDFEVGMTALLP